MEIVDYFAPGPGSTLGWLLFLFPLFGILGIFLARKAIRESYHSPAYRRSWVVLIAAAIYWNCCTWLVPIVVGLAMNLFELRFHIRRSPGNAANDGIGLILSGVFLSPLLVLPSPFVLYFLLKYRPSSGETAPHADPSWPVAAWLLPSFVFVSVLIVAGWFMGIGPGFPWLTVALYMAGTGCWSIYRLSVTTSHYRILWCVLGFAIVAYACVMGRFTIETVQSILDGKEGYLPHPIDYPLWPWAAHWLYKEPALGYPAVAWLTALLWYSPWRRKPVTNTQVN